MIKVLKKECISLSWMKEKQYDILVKCPHCEAVYTETAFSVGSCSYCQKIVPDVHKLIDNQFARLRYHFETDKPILFL